MQVDAFGNALGNAAIAGIEHENQVAAQKQLQASIEKLQATQSAELGASTDAFETQTGEDAMAAIRANGQATLDQEYAGTEQVLGDRLAAMPDPSLAASIAAVNADNQRIAAMHASQSYGAYGTGIQWMSAGEQEEMFDAFPSATYGASSGAGSSTDVVGNYINMMNQVGSHMQAAISGGYAGVRAIPDEIDRTVASAWAGVKNWASAAKFDAVSLWTNGIGADLNQLEDGLTQLPGEVQALPGEAQRWGIGMGVKLVQGGEQLLNYLQTTSGTQITYDAAYKLTSNASMIALAFGTDGLGEVADGGDLLVTTADASVSWTAPALDASTQKLVDDLRYAYLSGGDTTTPARALAELSTNVSGDGSRVILGQDPGYAIEAQTNGGIWFQTPDGVWPALTQDFSEAQGKDLGWLVNEQFLQTNLENGVSEFSLWNETPAEVLLNRKNSFTAREVNFLQDNAWRYGYQQQGSSWLKGH